MGKFLGYNSIKEINNELERQKKLRTRIQEHFNFEIVDYILNDIIEKEYFYHISLMINLAKMNNRISVENAKSLKNGLKQIYNIKSDFEVIPLE